MPEQEAGLLDLNPDVLHWQIERRLSRWGRWWARLKHRSVRHGRYQVWHVAGSNRILGIGLEDMLPVSVEAVQHIGAHYETV